ncbi:MAG: glycosyltransferase family 2 protein [Deltaproteobacteria bacterium]|nr:glycosyltransferase family 2 protein [Deltaproteobacteria bacterium]MBW2296963.1 glycosyltransferase family 2 protein [Deltaproteobacteria bacterium]
MHSISLMFPVYGDELTVQPLTEKAIDLFARLDCEYEIIIVDDGSPDRSGEIADELAQAYDCVKVIHHPVNKGYGAALRSGLAACTKDVICLTDGDDQYDVCDLPKLLKVIDYYPLVITFRYKKIYSTVRMFISWTYNVILRFLFRTHFRDISTGLRLVKRSLLADIFLESNSPFIGAELTIKVMLRGYPVGEVGIQTFPRVLGNGTSTSMKNILATIKDMIIIHRKIFSKDYDLPSSGERMEKD